MTRVEGSRPRVDILALGGTIAMGAGVGPGVSPRLDADQLLAALPDLGHVARLEAETIGRLPSVDLGFETVAGLAARIRRAVDDGAHGVVVTQGTDTLEEAAYLLDLLLDLDAPVVVTGAMRDPTQPGAEGTANLAAAVRVAAAGAARGLGVLAVMNDEIHAARFVTKRHTHKTSAFVSPAVGPLGWIVEGRVRVATRPTTPSPTIAWTGVAPRVALLPMVFGGDAEAVDQLLAASPAGLVVEAMGGGHVPARLVGPLARLAAEIPVVLASRAGDGEGLRHTYGYAGGEIDLLDRGLISAGALDARKARILLTLLLGVGADRAAVASTFEAVAS